MIGAKFLTFEIGPLALALQNKWIHVVLLLFMDLIRSHNQNIPSCEVSILQRAFVLEI